MRRSLRREEIFCRPPCVSSHVDACLNWRGDQVEMYIDEFDPSRSNHLNMVRTCRCHKDLMHIHMVPHGLIFKHCRVTLVDIRIP